MSLTLERIQGLIAGDGELPVKFAQEAKKAGLELVLFRWPLVKRVR